MPEKQNVNSTRYLVLAPLPLPLFSPWQNTRRLMVVKKTPFSCSVAFFPLSTPAHACLAYDCGMTMLLISTDCISRQ